MKSYSLWIKLPYSLPGSFRPGTLTRRKNKITQCFSLELLLKRRSLHLIAKKKNKGEQSSATSTYDGLSRLKIPTIVLRKLSFSSQALCDSLPWQRYWNIIDERHVFYPAGCSYKTYIDIYFNYSGARHPVAILSTESGPDFNQKFERKKRFLAQISTAHTPSKNMSHTIYHTTCTEFRR